MCIQFVYSNGFVFLIGQSRVLSQYALAVDCAACSCMDKTWFGGYGLLILLEFQWSDISLFFFLMDQSRLYFQHAYDNRLGNLSFEWGS